MPASDYKDCLDAFERLDQIYSRDRTFFRTGILISIAFLLGCALWALASDKADYVQVAGMFGSTGVLYHLLSQVMKPYFDSLKIIEGIRNDLNSGEKP